MQPRLNWAGLLAFFATAVLTVSGCAVGVDGDSQDHCALGGTSCGERSQAQMALLTPPPRDPGASDTYDAPPPPPARRACANAYESAECRWPGDPVDIRNTSACCGSVTADARCCAARGQACSNELGLTCCNGLKCGTSCTCE